MIDAKDVEVAFDGTLQDGCDSTEDNVFSGKPTLSFIKKVESAHSKEVVKRLQISDNEKSEWRG